MMTNPFLESCNESTLSKIDFYQTYQEPTIGTVGYVMVDDTDVVVAESKETAQHLSQIGFTLFGIATAGKQLEEMIQRAEYS